MSKNLSYQSFGSISLNRSAELLRGGYPQPPRFLMVGQEKNRAEAAVQAETLLIDLLIFRPSPDSLIGTESSGSAHALAYSLLTVRRLRPFARRRFSTRRPFLVLMRTRKPCARARRLLFG
jgi:hypothetical protein